MPPELSQRLVPDEGWLEAKSQNKMVQRLYMGDDWTPLRQSSKDTVLRVVRQKASYTSDLVSVHRLCRDWNLDPGMANGFVGSTGGIFVLNV